MKECEHKHWRALDSNRIGDVTCLDCNKEMCLTALINPMIERLEKVLEKAEKIYGSPLEKKECEHIFGWMDNNGNRYCKKCRQIFKEKKPEVPKKLNPNPSEDHWPSLFTIAKTVDQIIDCLMGKER